MTACRHRSYAAVQDLETAKELEETFGTYAVMATSEGSNTGTSGKVLRDRLAVAGRQHQLSRNQPPADPAGRADERLPDG